MVFLPVNYNDILYLIIIPLIKIYNASCIVALSRFNTYIGSQGHLLSLRRRLR